MKETGDAIYEEHKDTIKEHNTSWELRGWICPVCGAGNGPFVSRCSCVPLKADLRPYWDPWGYVSPTTSTWTLRGIYSSD